MEQTLKHTYHCENCGLMFHEGDSITVDNNIHICDNCNKPVFVGHNSREKESSSK